MLVKINDYDGKSTDFFAFYAHNERLDNVLIEIDRNLKGYVNDIALANKFSLSKGHLCRLFRLAYGRSLGAYIRSRKLSASIKDLLYSDLNIVDIALDYGFDYEQSYIRAFKREFGITPGGFRKSRQTEKTSTPAPVSSRLLPIGLPAFRQASG